MNILGIESSCDESAASIVTDGRTVRSSVVYSQIPLHQPYGGVVPEIASRSHIEKIGGVIREAVRTSGLGWNDVDAVAVTYGPGLASSLIVGLAAAKGLALALGKPLFGINHIEGHLHTPYLTPGSPDPLATVPALGLAVSGGHTTWVDIERYGSYKIIGQTLDDAAGEAFDKAAKLLGLGYPGGPVVDRIAKTADRIDAVKFPKGAPRAGTARLAGLDASLCVSFSGLKTSLLYHVKENPPKSDLELARIVAAYQEAIVGALADRTATALARRHYKALIVGGGVSLNGRLRARLAEVAEKAHVPLLLALPKYCGDNAAMIAGLAFYRRDLTGAAALAVDVHPSLQAGDEIA